MVMPRQDCALSLMGSTIGPAVSCGMLEQHTLPTDAVEAADVGSPP